MPTFKIKWTIEGEITLEASDVAEAERVAKERLVVVLTDTNRWPVDLGATGIAGAAEPVHAQ
jgi:hypothetical protein